MRYRFLGGVPRNLYCDECPAGIAAGIRKSGLKFCIAMNYKYLFLGVVSLAALSCVREPATDSGICPGREPEAVADDGSVISGWIRIKLQEDAAPLKVGGVYAR